MTPAVETTETGGGEPTQKQKEVLSDKEVVRRVQAGETVLFELLYRRHRQRLYRVARAIVRNDAEAADLVQETYLRAYSHLDQFAGRAKFSTWLTKIAIHLARDRTRRLGRKRGSIAVLTDEGKASEREVTAGADPERQVFGQEIRTILEKAIVRFGADRWSDAGNAGR